MRLEIILAGRLESGGTGGRGGVSVFGVATAAGMKGGTSVFGVSVMRSVRGCTALFSGLPVASVALASGVPGREERDAALREGARDVRGRVVSIFEPADGITGDSSFLTTSGVVSRFSFPGCGRLDAGVDACTCFSGDALALALGGGGVASFGFAGVSGVGVAVFFATLTEACLPPFLTDAILSAGVGSRSTAAADVAGALSTTGALPLTSCCFFVVATSAMTGFSSCTTLGCVSALFFSGSSSALASSVAAVAAGNNPGGSFGVPVLDTTSSPGGTLGVPRLLTSSPGGKTGVARPLVVDWPSAGRSSITHVR